MELLLRIWDFGEYRGIPESNASSSWKSLLTLIDINGRGVNFLTPCIKLEEPLLRQLHQEAGEWKVVFVQ